MSGQTSATYHWKMQRLTAIALIPLSLWFILSVASLAKADYVTVHQWISTPLTTALLTLFITLSSYHAVLGIEVVLQDYMNESTYRIFFSVIRLLLILAAALGVIAIFQISLGSL